jgi:uridine kinase
MDKNQIIEVTPRPTVEVHFPDQSVFSGPRCTPVVEFLKAWDKVDKNIIMAAVVNGELRELNYPIDMDARVRPVTTEEEDGLRIYRRSLTFLLEVAFEDLFPSVILTIDHSVASGGFFCQVSNRPPLTNKELIALETRMHELVKKDIAIERQQVSLTDAIQFFKLKGFDDKVRLLKYRQKEHLVLYRLEEHRDYHHGYMVPSLGYLRWFKLTPLGDGFVLCFPRRGTPTTIEPMLQHSKLLTTFQEYGNWVRRLGIEDVGALNEAIEGGRAREVILVTEALHGQRIAEIAQQITERAKEVRAILISGPSSSGKTTFSKRLAIQLLAQGLSPFALEMDNYFVDRDKTPRDEKGDYDFESIEALDRSLLNEHITRLIAGEQVQLPRYDFHDGKRKEGDVVKLGADQIIILEGIHGLNPALLPNVPSNKTFKIYASALTQLNLDRYNRIPTTDTRLLRRIVRDARDRGYSVQQTIQRWDSVQRGEKKYIFPYQEYADVMFNSALTYELSALKPLVEPLLRQAPYGTQEYVEAKRLLTFLEWFLPVDLELIPDNSILREFIGNSILSDFKLWRG